MLTPEVRDALLTAAAAPSWHHHADALEEVTALVQVAPQTASDVRAALLALDERLHTVSKALVWLLDDVTLPLSARHRERCAEVCRTLQVARVDADAIATLVEPLDVQIEVGLLADIAETVATGAWS